MLKDKSEKQKEKAMEMAMEMDHKKIRKIKKKKNY